MNSRWRGLLGTFHILMPTLACVLLPADAGWTVVPPKSPIAEREFLALFEMGRPIDSRIVPASVIVAALRFGQDAVASRKKRPVLVLTNSEIRGELKFDSLHQTPVAQLRNYARHRRADYPEQTTAVIGFPIDLAYSTFQQSVFLHNITFTERVSFRHVTFQDRAHFSGVIFTGDTSFGGTTFNDDATFDRSVFSDVARFYRVTFRGIVDFSNIRLRGLVYFQDSTFAKDAFFSDINQPARDQPATAVNSELGDLKFSQVTFEGRAYFDNSRFGALWLSTKPLNSRLSKSGINESGSGFGSSWGPAPSEQALREREEKRYIVGPVTFKERAVFSNLSSDNAEFGEAVFREYADFSQARFAHFVSFRATSFEGDVNFQATAFPMPSESPTIKSDDSSQQSSETGLIFDDVRFQKTFNLKWKQLDSRVKTKQAETWAQIEESFRRSGNLEGQNEAMYQRRLAESAIETGWRRVELSLANWYWGFGIRPWRLGAWTGLVYLFFTCIYWTQTKALASGMTKWRGHWERAKFSLMFSWSTAWGLDFGLRNARTPSFTIIGLVYSIGFKVMVLCLLHVFASISPLLNAIVTKLLPL